MYQIQNAQQITRIYNEYMVFDFPKDELKPLAHILSMVEDGTCTFYALKEDGRVLSYFSVCQNGNGLLVDYLAVNPELRGQGIGSRMLDFLKSIAEDKFIIIECEDVKLFFNNFILTTEDGVYHTFQIKRRDEVDGITIAQTATRRFYLRVSK